MSDLVALIDARVDRSGFQPSSPLREGLFERRLTTPITTPDDYARGFADGQALAGETFAAERLQLQALIAAATGTAPREGGELVGLIATTVERLVGEIVGRSAVDRDWLDTQVRRACAVIAECDAAQTLWLHPDDLALLDGSGIALDMRTDESAARGSLRIDCSTGWIEHGRSSYLTALHEALS